MKIQRAVTADYSEIQRFLEEVYGHASDYFSLFYPQVWKKENTDFKSILILKEKGKIISLVRIFPLETFQNGVNITLAGIGAVSTAYSHCGKGYMSKLLHVAFAEITKQNFPLSILSGDRHRYINFGYENGGEVLELIISLRGLRRKERTPLIVKRYAGEEDILSEMAKAYARLNFRKNRSIKEFREIYAKPGLMVYYTGEGEDFAFVVLSAKEVRDGNKQVFEFAGNNEVIPDILEYLVKRFYFNGFAMKFPGIGDVPENLFSMASHWSLSPDIMIKITNLRETIEIFSKQRGFFFPEGEELTLTIKKKESVIIKKENGVLEILNGSGINEVSLNESEMVRLLFGLPFWTPEGIDGKISRILRQFLPFSIFLGWLNRI